MNIQHDFSLQAFNTLGVQVNAANFVAVETVPQLQAVLAANVSSNILIIGGGSNLVFTADFNGLVIHNRIMGIDVIEETEAEVLLRVGGGMIWDQLVASTLNQGWFGLENLSLIPGTVGAAPVQNIGAYGVELRSVLEAVETVSLATGERQRFSNEQCQLSYRDSVFKQREKGRQFISHVLMRLFKRPGLTLGYGEVARCAEQWGYAQSSITPLDVREIIIKIRSQKLPDPALFPNVGSFFKNPVVPQQKYQQLLLEQPDIVAYPLPDGDVKLAAGWLIDRLKWKGRALGQAHVHDQQALVLINDAETSDDVLKLARRIQREVFERWAIELEIEPQIV